MPPLLLLLLLLLQGGRVCKAIRSMEMVNLQVEFGESAILPCNGSAYLEQTGSVQWEAMGEDVAILQGGEPKEGDRFKGRVQMPSEEKLRAGDWSVVLQQTMLSDTDMYECIWQGGRTISTVWLTVTAPHVERHLLVPAGDTAVLSCYIQMSRSQALDDLEVWWTWNSSSVVEASFSTAAEDKHRIYLLGDQRGQIHLHMSPAVMSDAGEYHCWYRTRDSADPRPGIPESITLTVLETNSVDTGFHYDETNTEDWIPGTDEVTEPPHDVIPVHQEDSTQPIKGAPETSTLPWIRIGLIAGVLLLTAVVLCLLGALRKI